MQHATKVSPRIDEHLEMNVSFYSIGGLTITKNKCELLCVLLKMNPQVFLCMIYKMLLILLPIVMCDYISGYSMVVWDGVQNFPATMWLQIVVGNLCWLCSEDTAIFLVGGVSPRICVIYMFYGCFGDILDDLFFVLGV